MPHIHTRAKRRAGLATHLRHHTYFHPQGRKKRSRTFTTEQAAQEWAQGKGIKEYSLKQVKRGKRFQIVEHGKN